MSKENIKDFFKNKITICCLILTAIYLLSGYCKWIEIGLPVFASVVFACMPIQFGFCIFAFLHCFTLSNIGYESTFVGTIIVYCLVLLVRYIIGVKKGKYQIYKPLLIAIAVLYGVSTITSFFFPIYVGGFYYYTYLPIFYCVFAMRKDLCFLVRFHCFALFCQNINIVAWTEVVSTAF